MSDTIWMALCLLLTFVCVAAILCGLAIVLLKPLLVRYALARPNARSSHKIPTPQGGGIAIIAAVIFTMILAIWFLENGKIGLIGFDYNLKIVLGCTVLMGLLGAVDDIHPLPAALRFTVQTLLAIVVTVIAVHEDQRIFPSAIPLIVERTIVVIGAVWFVNLVNFMDGLDWITVVEIVPVTAFIALVGFYDRAWSANASVHLTGKEILLAAALCGAMLGFAPFNKPVALLFLGDVGSLSIGLLTGYLLLRLAETGAVAAALLLPLYYLADATITLLKRLARREKIWQAHREHFYQRATDNGYSVMQVVRYIFSLNLCLAFLAGVSLLWPSLGVQIGTVAVGAALVASVLFVLSRPRGVLVSKG